MAQTKPITIYKPELRETARVWRRLLYSKIEDIFVYENLPEDIPVRFFNLSLFKLGKVVFYKIGDKYTVQPFSYNDILNWYYVPKRGRVVNPYLPSGYQNWEFDIDDEAVIYNSSPDIYNFRNNSIVSDLIFKTANQLSENDISYYCIQRNSRLIALFSAESDIQKREMDKIIAKMYNGDADITMEENLISHVHTNPLTQNSTRNSITELIEFQQYVLANFYHSFGINSNYNLKREQLNSDEINVNQEVLRLNIEDMLQVRKDGVEKINKKYGLNVTVELNEKLYATLLQQTEMFHNGTVDPETGLIDTYENVSQNDTERNEESGTGNKTEEKNNTSEEDRGTDNSERREQSSSGNNNSDNRDSTESKSSAERDRDNNISTEGNDTDNNENENDDVRNSGQTDGEVSESTAGSDEQSSENSETSHTMDDEDRSKPSDIGTDDDTASASGITINVNISQADGVEISADEPNVSIDEKLSQNGTNEDKKVGE